MAKEVIVDNEYMSLWYYPDKGIIHHEFHQYTKGQDLRDGLSKGAEILESRNVKKWLSDDRKNTVISEEDREWTANEWRPRVIKGGWKFWAIVLPEKAIGQLNMKNIIKQYADTGVTVQAFNSPEEAMKWLESQ